MGLETPASPYWETFERPEQVLFRWFRREHGAFSPVQNVYGAVTLVWEVDACYMSFVKRHAHRSERSILATTNGMVRPDHALRNRKVCHQRGPIRWTIGAWYDQ